MRGRTGARHREVARDYIIRARKRLAAIDALFQFEVWAGAVHESQEVVEFAPRSILRLHRIEAPRVNDMSAVLREESARFGTGFRSRLDEFCEISRRFRRNRELSFHDSEDLTPSGFYSQAGAFDARPSDTFIVSLAEAELAAAS